jgi:hypothetical protein
MTVFTRARHRFLSWANWIQSTLPKSISLFPFWSHPPIYALVFQVVSFFWLSHQKLVHIPLLSLAYRMSGPPPVTSFLFGPNIQLITLSSNILSLYNYCLLRILSGLSSKQHRSSADTYHQHHLFGWPEIQFNLKTSSATCEARFGLLPCRRKTHVKHVRTAEQALGHLF